MVLTRSKRKVIQDHKDDDVQIVTPSAPKKKTTAKKVIKKIMKEKDEEIEENKIWKDADVEVMITLRGEMEPEFLKNAKKNKNIHIYMLNFYDVLNFPCAEFQRKKIRFQNGPIGLLKALAFTSIPTFPP